MIDIGVEPLFDDDLCSAIPVADLGHDATGCCFNDFGKHAVLDAKTAFVLQEDDLVAGAK